MGKGKYKFWVLAAILLLSFCSIFTATVTLKWSSSTGTTLNSFSSNHSPFLDDLDVLEIEEREKVVKHMWEVYTHSHRIRLPKFWKEAFEAAYEDLISDDPDLRQSAISEIAKMSIRRSIIDLDDDAPDNPHHHHHPLQSTTNSQGTNKSRIEEAKGIKKNKTFHHDFNLDWLCYLSKSYVLMEPRNEKLSINLATEVDSVNVGTVLDEKIINMVFSFSLSLHRHQQPPPPPQSPPWTSLKHEFAESYDCFGSSQMG
ncbi:Protein of unknown function DUF1195 [Macleaya cordata]|uniref:Uncharacterized protein n=1 Tax=Macleaya cordata TaxID=56857 RepID=A0A200R7L4_MACCD|nr:Protein of unknown function DUF1195 [Macleaya cordata]